MRLERVTETGWFIDAPELEPVWGAVSILTGEQAHSLCTELYGTDQIERWKKAYRFLFEIFPAIADSFGTNLMDDLLELPADHLTLDNLQDTILSKAPADFLWRFLGLEYSSANANRDVLGLALTDDQALDVVYSWISPYCSSFLAVSALVRQSDRFRSEFFSFARELQTPALKAMLTKQEQHTERLFQTIAQGSVSGDLLGLSQDLMGKTFRNRGPYTEFFFLPSLLLPMRACRFFHTQGSRMRQILFLSLRQSKRDQDEKVKALKAMADPTRYQILCLLAAKGPMRGLDIAKQVSVAASTISHHMEQLKECGLITEEPVKNAKYFGISKQTVISLLAEIQNDFEAK